MIFKQITVENFYTFKARSEFLCPESVSVLLGRNNTGKSNIVRLLGALRRWGESGHVTSMNEMLRYPCSFGRTPTASVVMLDFHEDVSTSIATPQIVDDLKLTITLRFDQPNPVIEVEARLGRKGKIVRQLAMPSLEGQVTFSPEIEDIGAITIDQSVVRRAFKSIFTLRAERHVHVPLPQARGQFELTPNCDNVLQVLNSIAAGKPEMFAQISADAAALLPGVNRVLAPLDQNSSSLVGQAHEAAFPTLSFDWDDLASGTRHLIAILTLIRATPPGSLLVIEEPEAFLHPDLATRLFLLMTRVAREQRKQIILTTHSPLLHELAAPSGVNIVVRNPDSGEATIEHLNQSAEKCLRRRGLYRNLTLAARQPGFVPSAFLIVEGDDDVEVWESWIRGHRLSGCGVVVTKGDSGGTGAVDVATYLNHQNNVGVYCAPFLLVVDGDRENESKKEALKEKLPPQRFHVLAQKEIEDYLRDAEAISGLFKLDGTKVRSELGKAGRRGKEGLDEMYRKLTGRKKNLTAEQKGMLASRVPLDPEIRDVLDRLADMIQPPAASQV